MTANRIVREAEPADRGLGRSGGWPTSKGQRNGRFNVNKEEEEKTLEASKTVR